MHIWKTLQKPILIQAPMEDVTDTVFRQIIGSVGKPDIYFTEFTNVEGILQGSSEYINQHLLFNKKKERPIIAQIWGKNPESYYKVAKKLARMEYDGIDINMGCPDRKVVKNGCCSALIKNHFLAKKIFEATQKGANNLPVSIKTRIGFSHIQTEEWIGFLLSLKPAALTVHARTVKEMSKVPAHWVEIKKSAALRDEISPETFIIGNGDVISLNQALEYCKTYNCDGVMIGRGMLYNPWVFNKNIHPDDILTQDKLQLLKKHIELFEKTWGRKKKIDLMKKFYKAYINGFENAHEIRAKLFSQKTPKEAIEQIKKLISEKHNFNL